MTTESFAWAPAGTHGLLRATIETVRTTPGIVGLTVGGSAASGEMDEYSDLDFVVVCTDEDHAGVLNDAQTFARRIGPLLAAFTGEHVGERRLLICLYGPPLRHVDLKFVSVGQLASRYENGRVLWQQDGLIDEAFQQSPETWQENSPQWIEDRFWTWVHYGATKIGRGENFECLDHLAFLRGAVFGPLIARRCGHRANRVRRIEQIAPEMIEPLAATIGDQTARGCRDAMVSAANLYRELRDADAKVVRNLDAERAAMAYLTGLAID